MNDISYCVLTHADLNARTLAAAVSDADRYDASANGPATVIFEVTRAACGTYTLQEVSREERASMSERLKALRIESECITGKRLFT